MCGERREGGGSHEVYAREAHPVSNLFGRLFWGEHHRSLDAQAAQVWEVPKPDTTEVAPARHACT